MLYSRDFRKLLQRIVITALCFGLLSSIFGYSHPAYGEDVRVVPDGKNTLIRLQSAQFDPLSSFPEINHELMMEVS